MGRFLLGTFLRVGDLQVLLDVFFVAMARNFSLQVLSIWRLAIFWALLREATGCRLGVMRNTIFDLSVLSTFDGGADGAPVRLSGGGVFRDRFGVSRGFFAIHHGSGFAFEAELATTFSAVEISFERRWMHLWLESDSIYVVTIFRNRNSIVTWSAEFYRFSM
ncbi:hypothetical protein ACS0TY_014521 [Phlomoides rotata]